MLHRTWACPLGRHGRPEGVWDRCREVYQPAGIAGRCPARSFPALTDKTSRCANDRLLKRLWAAPVQHIAGGRA